MKIQSGKTLLAAIIILLFASIAAAQPSFIKNIIDETNQNVLYIGFDNEVHVSSEGTPFEELDLDVPYGYVKKTASSFFVKVGYSDTIKKTEVTLYSMVNGQRREFLKKSYDIRPMPDPEVTIPGTVKGKTTRELLSAQRGISLTYPGFTTHKFPFSVTGFSMTFISKDKTFKVTSTIGRYTEEQIKAIEEIIAGDQLLGDNLSLPQTWQGACISCHGRSRRDQ